VYRCATHTYTPLARANDGITAGQNSLQAGAAAIAAGDAPTSPGANNTVGGTAQARAETILGEKTDMSGEDAGAAVQGILQSGQQQCGYSGEGEH